MGCVKYQFIMQTPKLLFVCLGNICRSPTAEAIASKMIQDQGLGWMVDSAGTSDYHNGEKADARSIEHARARGYDVTSLSRPVIQDDFERFDWIFAMDESNLKNLKQMCRSSEHLTKIVLMTDYCRIHKCQGVPDPYYGGRSDFEKVIDILEDAVSQMILQLRG